MTDKVRTIVVRISSATLVVVAAAVGGWTAAIWSAERKVNSEHRQWELEEDRWQKDAAHVPGRAPFVTAVDLITDPERYNGTRVILSGVWKVGFEDSSLDLENAAQYFWIWVEPDWLRIDEPLGDLSRRTQNEHQTRGNQGSILFRIVAEGSFKFRKNSIPRELDGFGHMGVFEGLFIIDRLFQFEVLNPVEPNPMAGPFSGNIGGS
jgi:hypothetical protein